MRRISDTTILITGIIAWLLLAFASIKLSLIYARNPLVAYLLSYNIASFVFLLYFIGYFKERFGIKYLLLLVVAYNFGINGLWFLYNELFLLYSPAFEMQRAIASASINLVVMVITWLLLYWFIRKKK